MMLNEILGTQYTDYLNAQEQQGCCQTNPVHHEIDVDFFGLRRNIIDRAGATGSCAQSRTTLDTHDLFWIEPHATLTAELFVSDRSCATRHASDSLFGNSVSAVGTKWLWSRAKITFTISVVLSA